MRRVRPGALLLTLQLAAAGPALAQAMPSARSAADSLRARIELVRTSPAGFPLPTIDSISAGDRIVPVATRIPGTLAVVRGNLDVFGVVDGDAIAIDGDVIVHEGGRVHGNAYAAFGRVRLEGGMVQGETRAFQGKVVALPRGVVDNSPAGDTSRALGISLGWLAMLVGIGLGVLIFAGGYLDAVVETLEHSFSRSLWVGLAGQLAIIPALLILTVGLAITILGILLIPFGIVAFALAVAGVVTLGFLAAAQLTGRSMLGRKTRPISERGIALQALVLGLVLFLGLWVLGAALTWSPVAALAVRGAALAVTWVAATAGFGAAILSRGGTRRAEVAPAPAIAPEPFNWQTPTPVQGVVAARRPTPPPRPAER